MTPDARDAEPETATRRSDVLERLERWGNRCPDPIMLFLLALALTFVASSVLAGRDFGLSDPRTGQPLRIVDQLTLEAIASFFAGVTQNFVGFPPLGIVLVMVLGVGVAECSGLVGSALRGVLAVAPSGLLVPLVAASSIAAHALGDSAVVLVVPLGGALFYVAGRHPVAGIIASFAPNLGVLFANFLPLALDPLLAGFTESAARIVDPAYRVNPLSNYGLAIAIGVATIPVTWWLVTRVVEPRLARMTVDGDPAGMPAAPALTTRERRALLAAAATAAVVALVIAFAVLPADSPFRAGDGSLTSSGSPLMNGLIPLLLVLTILPSIAFGLVAGTLRSHRDAVEGMRATMATMASYIVMVFFAAQFTKLFAESNLGALIALEGAAALRASGVPAALTILGIVVMTAGLDIFVPSASAKWALLAPIFVPMLMSVGIAPELTQAAFRIGDGPVNLLTPLMPYYPLVLSFCRRYVKDFGAGTLMSLALPFGTAYLVMQVILLMVWWAFGLPLGIGGRYQSP